MQASAFVDWQHRINNIWWPSTSIMEAPPVSPMLRVLHEPSVWGGSDWNASALNSGLQTTNVLTQCMATYDLRWRLALHLGVRSLCRVVCQVIDKVQEESCCRKEGGKRKLPGILGAIPFPPSCHRASVCCVVVFGWISTASSLSLNCWCL